MLSFSFDAVDRSCAMTAAPPVDSDVSFDALPLDDRLRKAVAHIGWSSPSLVQAKTLPLAMQGKDVLCRARTGSGKTGAFALPILHKILEFQSFNAGTKTERKGPNAVVLVPTRELVEQVRKVFSDLTHFAPSVSIAAITADTSVAAQKSMLVACPHVVIATPARLNQHLKLGNVRLRESVEVLALDEADLLLSFGFEHDIKAIAGELPNICQTMLMSATLGEDIDTLKSLVMHNPVTLKLEEDEGKEGQLTQFSLRCSEKDKFLIAYVLLKLGILTGKVLFFVNNVDRCYELKLFLEQFSIRAAVLNSELPHNSRASIIQGFNRGVFNYVIATDESASEFGRGGGKDQEAEEELLDSDEEDQGGEMDEGEESAGAEEEGKEDSEVSADESGAEAESEEEVAPQGKREKGKSRTSKSAKTKRGAKEAAAMAQSDEDDDEVEEDVADDDEASAKSDEEDESAEEQEESADRMASEEDRVQGQRAILDVANKAKSGAKSKQTLKKAIKSMDKKRDREYGVSRGVDFKGVDVVVNFDLPRTLRAYTHRVGRTARAGQSGTALSLVGPDEAARIEGLAAKQAARGDSVVQPLPFNLSQVEGFRYRAEDSLGRVTRLAVKRARVKELEAELLNSETLKQHFEANPQDLKALRHDRQLNPARVAPHLATVPSYLLPAALKSQMVSNKREAKRRAQDSARGAGGGKKRRQDPLNGASSAVALEPDAGGEEDASVERRRWASEDPALKAERLKARYERKRMQAKKMRREKVHGRGGKVNSRNAKNARMKGHR